MFNHINLRSFSGLIAFDPNGFIRWQHVIDFEETDPSVKTIDNAFNAGSSKFTNWLEEISEVALTKTTAQEIIDRLNSNSASESSEEEVPDSI